MEKYAVFRVCILWSGCGSDVIFHRVSSLILKIYFFSIYILFILYCCNGVWLCSGIFLQMYIVYVLHTERLSTKMKHNSSTRNIWLMMIPLYGYSDRKNKEKKMFGFHEKKICTQTIWILRSVTVLTKNR